jgi:hypothetical protein
VQLMVLRYYIGALVLLVSFLAPKGVSSNSNAIIPSTNGKWHIFHLSILFIEKIIQPQYDFNFTVPDMLNIPCTDIYFVTIYILQISEFYIHLFVDFCTSPHATTNMKTIFGIAEKKYVKLYSNSKNHFYVFHQLWM